MHNKCMGLYGNLGHIAFCPVFVSIMVKKKSLLKVSPLYDSWNLYQGTCPSTRYNPPISRLLASNRHKLYWSLTLLLLRCALEKCS